MNRIIILLCGGLGNQLFQYAYGRAITKRSNARLYLDAVSLFRYDKTYKRSYALYDFSIPPEVIIIQRPPALEKMTRKVRIAFNTIRPFAMRTFFDQTTQDPSEFEAYRTLTLNHSATLVGYWQDLSFFQEVTDLLREDLRIQTPLPESLADTRDHILNCNAVAVHVRKLQYGNTIGPEYYIEAINRIRKKVLFPHFFIFSDSPTWWQENMPDMEDTNLIPNLQQAAIHDFHLMTLCKHFIVPDSTFSWWASQLARNDNKICIFPKNYARGARGILL